MPVSITTSTSSLRAGAGALRLLRPLRAKRQTNTNTEPKAPHLGPPAEYLHASLQAIQRAI